MALLISMPSDFPPGLASAATNFAVVDSSPSHTKKNSFNGASEQSEEDLQSTIEMQQYKMDTNYRSRSSSPTTSKEETLRFDDHCSPTEDRVSHLSTCSSSIYFGLENRYPADNERRHDRSGSRGFRPTAMIPIPSKVETLTPDHFRSMHASHASAPSHAPGLSAAAAAAAGGGASGAAGGEMVYRVQFKHYVRNYIRSPEMLRAPSSKGAGSGKGAMVGDLVVGDYVKVEADRGEDMGVVLEAMPIQQLLREATVAAARGDDEFGIVQKGRIFGVASAFEKQQMAQKYRDELLVVREAELIAARHGVRATILDAEYQFDRATLTVFYSAEVRIDFRNLVRDLFARFKSRIWMKQIFHSQEEREQQKVQFRQQQSMRRQQVHPPSALRSLSPTPSSMPRQQQHPYHHRPLQQQYYQQGRAPQAQPQHKQPKSHPEMRTYLQSQSYQFQPPQQQKQQQQQPQQQQQQHGISAANEVHPLYLTSAGAASTHPALQRAPAGVRYPASHPTQRPAHHPEYAYSRSHTHTHTYPAYPRQQGQRLQLVPGVQEGRAGAARGEEEGMRQQWGQQQQQQQPMQEEKVGIPAWLANTSSSGSGAAGEAGYSLRVQRPMEDETSGGVGFLASLSTPAPHLSLELDLVRGVYEPFPARALQPFVW